MSAPAIDDPLAAIISDISSILGMTPGTMTSTCSFGTNLTVAQIKTYMNTSNKNYNNLSPFTYLNIDSSQTYVIDPMLHEITYNVLGPSVSGKTLQTMVIIMAVTMCGTAALKTEIAQYAQVFTVNPGQPITAPLALMLSTCQYGNISGAEAVKKTPGYTAPTTDVQKLMNEFITEIYEQKCHATAGGAAPAAVTSPAAATVTVPPSSVYAYIKSNMTKVITDAVYGKGKYVNEAYVKKVMTTTPFAKLGLTQSYYDKGVKITDKTLQTEFITKYVAANKTAAGGKENKKTRSTRKSRKSRKNKKY